jgi:CheY-like chemotaxis protein
VNPGQDMRKVLLVHPDPLTRRMAASTSAAMGIAQVVDFESATSASQAMRTGGFSAVILASDDQQSIAQVVRALRPSENRSAKDLPVLVLSDSVAQQDPEMRGVRVASRSMSVRTMLLEMHSLLGH